MGFFIFVLCEMELSYQTTYFQVLGNYQVIISVTVYLSFPLLVWAQPLSDFAVYLVSLNPLLHQRKLLK